MVTIGVFCRPLPNGQNDLAQVRNYVDAIEAAGARADIITLGDRSPGEAMAHVDGLLLPGGAEVDPALYNSARTWPQSKNFSAAFDRFQISCAQVAYAAAMPMLGICRGMQLMNVAGGGTLVQDIDRDIKRPANLRIEHRQQRIAGMEEDHGPTHVVRLAPQSDLARLFGSSALAVNSFHHQAIGTVAPIFGAVAWSPDGVVEGIERKDMPQQRGVQWHPERQRLLDSQWNKLFEKLVADAAQWKAGQGPQPRPLPPQS